MPDDLPYNLAPDPAAKVLGVHPATLKRWARDGRVPAIRTPGGHWRFRRTDLDAFVAEMQANATVDLDGAA